MRKSKRKVTYGAAGLMDWMAEIPAGKARVKIHFTGGALTAYGVTPAEYTTENPFYQKVIEGSEYFADGRIYVLRERVEEETTEQKGEAVAESTEAPKEKVEVKCLQDAQAYLQEHYGIASRNVRSKAAVTAAGAEKGIDFVFVTENE